MSVDLPGVADVYLHIGTMKTGTSYLQQVLESHPEQLAEEGVLYVNRGRDAAGAVRDVLSLSNRQRNVAGAWERMVGRTHAWPGRAVVISSELLSFADDATAERVVESLRPARVTVLVTARDLARLLPSAWQNKIKHGRSWSLHTYLEAVMTADADPRGSARSFWHHHDLGRIVGRWVRAASAADVVVIPVPPDGSEPRLLWRRFAEVIGLNVDAYETNQDQRSNFSLGYPETELLRSVNRELKTTFDNETRRQYVLKYLANEVLRPDPSSGAVPDRAVLPPAVYDWAVVRSRELADEVVALGVRVQGDIDDLVPILLTDEERAAAATDTNGELPAWAVRLVTTLVTRLAEAESSAPQDSAGPLQRRARPAGPDA